MDGTREGGTWVGSREGEGQEVGECLEGMGGGAGWRGWMEGLTCVGELCGGVV
jgi:hypothetical protein